MITAAAHIVGIYKLISPKQNGQCAKAKLIVACSIDRPMCVLEGVSKPSISIGSKRRAVASYNTMVRMHVFPYVYDADVCAAELSIQCCVLGHIELHMDDAVE